MTYDVLKVQRLGLLLKHVGRGDEAPRRVVEVLLLSNPLEYSTAWTKSRQAFRNAISYGTHATCGGGMNTHCLRMSLFSLIPFLSLHPSLDDVCHVVSFSYLVHLCI